MPDDVGRFQVVTDDGTEYTVIDYAPPLREEGPSMWPKFKGRTGLGKLETIEGYHVNLIAEGVYEILRPFGVVKARAKDGTEGSSAQ